jgi:hypothetical protein
VVIKANTATTINGVVVLHGDKIRTFRGEVMTFNYEYGGKIYVNERPNGFNHRVFVDKA